MRSSGPLLAVAVVVTVMASGCLYFPYAQRNAGHQPQAKPWWCTSDVGADLSTADCNMASLQFDAALVTAYAHWHASDAIAEGAISTPYESGVGAAFVLHPPNATFNAAVPDTLLYAGTEPSAQLAGLEWHVPGASAPAGFAGSNDVWTDAGDGVWTLRAWIVRPFENQANVFATTHPCLDGTGPTYDVTSSCSTSTHSRPLEILVSNDDGYNAPGIDAEVEALRVLPNVHVTVVAPATNQSGAGDKTTPGGATGFAAVTASGYPATAVNGYPADAVNYALKVMGVNPDLVVSGSNLGQNIGPLVPLSGTVGAARTGSRNGIPALAVSSGFGSPPDYASAVTATLAWVADFRLGRAGPPYQVTASLNVPTCTAGSIRGQVTVPTASAANGRPLNPSNCLSTVTTFADDVDAFINGYTSLSDVGT